MAGLVGVPSSLVDVKVVVVLRSADELESPLLCEFRIESRHTIQLLAGCLVVSVVKRRLLYRS